MMVALESTWGFLRTVFFGIAPISKGLAATVPDLSGPSVSEGLEPIDLHYNDARPNEKQMDERSERR